MVDEFARQLLRVYRLVGVREQWVISEAQARGLPATNLAELRACPIEKRDALATTFLKAAKIWATSNGASLGAAGVVTMAADAAALVAVNLRLAQSLCVAYGLPLGPHRVDAWGLLLSALGETVDLTSLRRMAPTDAAPAAERLLAETARAFAKRLVRRGAAARAVPILGAVVGGFSNYAYTSEVGARAREFYRGLAASP